MGLRLNVGEEVQNQTSATLSYDVYAQWKKLIVVTYDQPFLHKTTTAELKKYVENR